MGSVWCVGSVCDVWVVCGVVYVMCGFCVWCVGSVGGVCVVYVMYG